jgi:site-specific DNA-methyltransferase (adenine-specific)
MGFMNNKVYYIDNIEGMAKLPEKCANLIISDPPYYRVKGDFDFDFADFEEYKTMMRKQAKAYKRILADNGTLFVYGNAKNIAYVQVIFDEYFNLLNSIVWENTNDHKQQIRFNEDLRTFAPLTERILMYDNAVDKTGLQEINNDQTLYRPIRDYFLEQKKNCKYTFKQINEECFGSASNGGGMASNILTSYKDGWTFPTQEKYKALQKIGLCPKPYEELKAEYEELRRPFNNCLHLGDVIRLPNYETSDYDHDTIKPEKLTRILITTCSRISDLVVVPFAGSGTECAMSAKEKRPFIGYEITEKHAKMSQDRANKILSEPTLF